MIAPPAVLLRRSAEAFAAQGWHVIPTAGKVPRTEHGVDDATTDPALIAQWWNRWPTAGIGVACGPSGLLVVDLDGPDATATWRELAREHGLAPTRTARTGRPDGWHLYYRHTPASAGSPDEGSGTDLAAVGATTRPVDVAQSAGRIRNSAGQLAPDIDIRTAGGYVIAPPSLHELGTALYTWHIPAGATRPLPVSDTPVWLLDTLATADAPGSGPAAGASGSLLPAVVHQRYLDAAIAGEASLVAAAVEGTRNHTLNRAAFALAALGVPEAAIRERLTHAARDAGLHAREIDRTLTSGISAGQLHPRQAVTITRPAATTTETAATRPTSSPDPAEHAQAQHEPATTSARQASAIRPTTTRETTTGGASMTTDPTDPAALDPEPTLRWLAPDSAIPLSNDELIELGALVTNHGAPTADPGDIRADAAQTTTVESVDLPALSSSDQVQAATAPGRPPSIPPNDPTSADATNPTEASADHHRVEQLRAWAARTGQGTTLPVERVAGFGAHRAAALGDGHDRIEAADDQELQVLVKPGAAQIAQMHADAQNEAARGGGAGTTPPGRSQAAEASTGTDPDPPTGNAPRVAQINDVRSSPTAVGDADPTGSAGQLDQTCTVSVVEGQGQRHAVRPFQRTHLDHLRAEYGALLAARDELVAASLHAASGRLSDSDRHQAQAIRHRAYADRHADRAVADLAGLDPDDVAGSRPSGRGLGLTVHQARGWYDADVDAGVADRYDARDRDLAGGWDDGRAGSENLVSSGADDGWDRGL